MTAKVPERQESQQMRTTVIIGSGFGDCGKGKMVDHLVTPNSMVVRFNGGAQARHTVVRGAKKHVFSHFGSGTLQAVPTYLSRFFIHNPILYFRELSVLQNLGCEPRLYVDPLGIATTPWDMMINQIAEESRGVSRHGSCGVGINETIQRHAAFPFQVMHMKDAKARSESIMHDWVSRRLKELGIDPSPVWRERLRSTAILDRFVEHCDEYMRSVVSMNLEVAMGLEHTDNLVFEGAQGLLLHQDHRFFPYVTHSKTGSENPAVIISEQNIRDVDVVYVTRAYATRHGAGPFPREDAALSYADETNAPNDWQGALRFGLLDLDLLAESIGDDMCWWPSKTTTMVMAITCLDQVGETVEFWQFGKRRVMDIHGFVGHVCQTVGAEECLMSFGPTSSDVIKTAI
jgi:adenylosuccinate synthase